MMVREKNHNQKRYFFPRLYLLSLFLLFINLLSAQKVRQIEIVNSDAMEFDISRGVNAIRYIGNVIFKQEDMVMYCDSAYYFSDANIVNAYNHVHIAQGDTLHLYGDLLRYLGNEKMAEVRDNVTLIDKETTLKTQYLDFDLKENIGYYSGGGTIENGNNHLISRIGYYFSRARLFHFLDSVVITNPDYTIYADTLQYNTETEVSYFFGPTEIISENNYIYCENGWYDTRNNISQFNKNAYIISEGQYLKGDSLYYERDNGLGKAFDNVELYDSTQNIILRGKYAIYRENPEYAMLTDSAEFIQISEGDTMFVHADTLESILDSTGIYNILKAYYRVKIYRLDLQGKCDSLVYLESDSVFQLFYEPVLWSDENQLTSQHIDIHLANRKLDYIELLNSSFIIVQEDSIRFNQIKGRNMTGYFRDNKLVRLEVKGNGQTIYFPKDQGELIGVNKAESTDITIYLKDNKIERIKLILKPEATLYPPENIPKEEIYLKGFLWLDKHRPKKKEDIFSWED